MCYIRFLCKLRKGDQYLVHTQRALMHARHLGMLAILRRIILIDIRRHSSCNTRPSCCNAGVYCLPGDLRHPKCAQAATYRGIWLATAELLRLAVSKSRRQNWLGVDVHCCPGTRSFQQCAGQMEQTLDLKFNLRNVGRSSYLVRSLIAAFGRT